MLDLPDDIPGAAIALTTAVAALVAIVVCAAYAVRRGLSAWRSATAAQALVDVHLAELDARMLENMRRVAALEPQAGKLHESMQGLQASMRQLRYLSQQIARDRARLERRVLDVLLPTGAGMPRRASRRAAGGDGLRRSKGAGTP